MTDPPEAPPWTFQVVSVEMPCGAAMLANVFAAWGLPIIDPWGLDTSELYRKARAGWIRLADGPSGFESLCPVFAERQHFHWNRDCVPRFHHRTPDRAPPLTTAIWLLRDPRDALYSDWRRRRTDGQDFAAYLTTEWNGTGRTPVQFLTDWHQAWLRAGDTLRLLRIHFESIKDDPVRVFRAIADHLGLPVSAGAWAEVPQLVDINHARRVTRTMPQTLRPSFDLHRAGRPGEWRTSWSETCLAMLPGEFTDLLDVLGYEA